MPLDFQPDYILRQQEDRAELKPSRLRTAGALLLALLLSAILIIASVKYGVTPDPEMLAG